MGKLNLACCKVTRSTPLDGIADRYPTMLSVIAAGEAALDAIAAEARKEGPTVALKDAMLLAPIERPGKYLAIGMNYRKHMEEAKRLGVPTPTQQLWFNKQTTCLSGPYDDIDPGVSEQLDYEVELGVVIGKPVKGVSEAQAKRLCVFGYFTGQYDVSARDWQRHTRRPSPWASRSARTPTALSDLGLSPPMKFPTRTSFACAAG